MCLKPPNHLLCKQLKVLQLASTSEELEKMEGGKYEERIN